MQKVADLISNALRQTPDHAKARGDEAGDPRLVVGIKAWF